MIDEYLTIEGLAQSEMKVKGSRFIATAKPLGTEGEAKSFLQQISSEFRGATHHSYAYRLKGGIFRFSDAGEPSGTAGKPILRAIDSQGLIDLALVVTRYFGGTKLGIGGLSRAYHQAALSCLQGARIVTAYITEDLTLGFPYDQTNAVKGVLAQFGAVVTSENYSGRVQLKVTIRSSLIERFQEAMNEATNGKTEITF